MVEADSSLYATIGGTPAIVSIVTAIIIAVAVTRYYAIKGKITKALGWTPQGIARIVGQPVAKVSEGLALTWKGEKLLLTPYTVRLRISNIGSREVIGDLSHNNSDYEEPLVIKFNRSTCYEAIITRTSKTTLKTPVSILETPTAEFIVSMPTLNASAWIELEMIADGETEYPQVNCALAGETQQIMPVAGRQRSQIRSSMLGIGGLGVVVLTIGFGLLGYQSFTMTEGPTLWPVFLMIAGGLILIAALVVYVGSWLSDRQEWNAMKRAEPTAFK
jgi:hypothetical protein